MALHCRQRLWAEGLTRAAQRAQFESTPASGQRPGAGRDAVARWGRARAPCTGPKVASSVLAALYDERSMAATALTPKHTRSRRLEPATEPALQAASAQLYQALQAHDARFDGRFFVGVTSTHIYCRPVCRVRVPLARNCRFFSHAALAECAGFRPCMRCRPELAPGLSLVDSSQALAGHAARQLEQAARAGDALPMPAVAARLGVTDRHLRRIFQAQWGVSPLEYLTTQRLLHAKQLLTDTALPVAQVALACGYASLRRFNAAFLARYRMNPSALRRERVCAVRPTGALRPADPARPIELRLSYRPPYDIEGVLRFLSRRAVANVEVVDIASHRYGRTLCATVAGQCVAGWISAQFVPARHEVHVQVAPALLPALGRVLQQLRRGLDLDADPQAIDAALDTLPHAVPGPAVAGLRLVGTVDGFEAAVRVILGQQITVAAARTLTARLVARFGEPLPCAPSGRAGCTEDEAQAAPDGANAIAHQAATATAPAGLTQLFPTATALAQASAEDIGRLGIVRQRVGALQALAREVQAGRIVLDPSAPLEPTLEALRALPGVGEWTTQLIALRALAWPDAFPATDIGVLDALVPTLGARDAKGAETLSQHWRPWRSYAVMRLWQSLESET
jgi:AraC family transcriptional regulator, regulatory protein of adaptative response / DNA-3-methyladenine glycosylase II